MARARRKPPLARPTAAKWKRLTGDNGVVVLSGYGLRIAVSRGHLTLEDGVADRHRARRMSRVDRGVKRIAIIGHAGTISLDAIRWLHDVKIPLVHLDTDGRVLAQIAPDAPDHPLLRRAQARAVESNLGVEIMRDLLCQKISGQERVLREFTAGQLALPQMELARRALARATSFVELRSAESQAAAAYWGVWGRVRVDFRVADQDHVPEHWRTFGQRVSALTGSPRLAINPANALLNYLYAILESEARLALLAVGCDPGVGIQHADQRARDSMACDVMEAIRPEVDAWLLTFLTHRTLRRRDFLELRNGQCRLMPELAKELAQTAGLWSLKLGPVVEGVAETLHRHATAPERQSPWAHSKLQRASSTPLPTSLTESRRKASVRRAIQDQPEVARELEEGEEASVLGPTLRMTRQQFMREVLPELRSIPAETLADAVGLSVTYCARIRTGRSIPNHRHWGAFAEAARRSRALPTAEAVR